VRCSAKATAAHSDRPAAVNAGEILHRRAGVIMHHG
jgi:hypothetical protein